MTAVSLRLVGVVLSVGVVLAGCGGDQDALELQQRAEERAVQTRGYVDDLVTRLDGSVTEVTEDSIDVCDLTDPDGGLVHNYSLRFTVDNVAVDRLQGEIAVELKAGGWTVRRDPRNDDRGTVSVRFLKDSFSIGATISDSGNATAGGSSGCVE